MEKQNLSTLINQLSHAVERFGGKTTITQSDIRVLKSVLEKMK